MELRILNPADVADWDEFVYASPRGSFFHTVCWCRVLTRAYGYKPVYFTLWKNGRCEAAIPLMEVNSVLTGHRVVSLPFTDYCEPLAAHEEVSRVLFDIIRYEAKRKPWQYIELRGGSDFLGDGSAAAYHFRHTLDLSAGSDRLFKNLRDSTRRNIKKAQKEDVEIRFDESLEALSGFYELNCVTRRDHGLPPQPWQFFLKVQEEIISKGLGFVALALHQGETVAANVYFHGGRQAIYKYGASDKRWQHLRANNLLMWESIRRYADSGYRSFCFGRTEPENEGLRQFKTGWGADEQVINYYRYDLGRQEFIQAGNGLSSKASQVFSHLPIPALRAIGGLLYKHVG